MNPILVTGFYDPNDPTHGDGLGQWIAKTWKAAYGIDITTTVYDRDVLSLIPATGPCPPLIGFSFGGWKVVEVCKSLGVRSVGKVALVDPVWEPNPQPQFAGFTLPDNVLSAFCVWRGYNNQQRIYSGPILKAKCPFVNQKRNPTPGQHSEAEEHGEYIRTPAAKLVVDWVRAA